MENDKLIECIAAKVHQAYLDTCDELGWNVNPENRVPYHELTEDSKELDRATARVAIDEYDAWLREELLVQLNKLWCEIGETNDYWAAAQQAAISSVENIIRTAGKEKV